MNDSLRQAAVRSAAFTSDSRTAGKGDVFVALKGSQVDGHDFVASVLAQGADYAVVRKGWNAPGVDAARLIPVDDPHAAHRELAGLFRAKFRGKVIAIGGSSGKTSAKEFLAQLLAERFRIIKTEGSQNGELGIPKTLERLRADVEVAVVEVGIDAPGDMIRHASLVNPDMALLTSIGEEHLNLLKTVDRVFQEEKILFDVTLARGGVCFAPGSDPWLRKLAGTTGVMLTPAEPSLFSLKAADALRAQLPNAYAIQNATLALAVARELGLTEAEMLRGVAKLRLPEGRGNVAELPGNLTLIGDHYNSNPSSLQAGLDSAASRARLAKKPLYLVLADMLDLGDQTRTLHDSVLSAIRGAKPTKLFTVGPEMKRLGAALRSEGVDVTSFDDSVAAAAHLRNERPKDTVLLLKGSNGMKLVNVLNALKE